MSPDTSAQLPTRRLTGTQSDARSTFRLRRRGRAAPVAMRDSVDGLERVREQLAATRPFRPPEPEADRDGDVHVAAAPAGPGATR